MKRWPGIYFILLGTPNRDHAVIPEKIDAEQGLMKIEDAKECLIVQINYYLRTGKMDILCLISRSLMYIK
jgi:hypothetical protein